VAKLQTHRTKSEEHAIGYIRTSLHGMAVLRLRLNHFLAQTNSATRALATFFAIAGSTLIVSLASPLANHSCSIEHSGFAHAGASLQFTHTHYCRSHCRIDSGSFGTLVGWTKIVANEGKVAFGSRASFREPRPVSQGHGRGPVLYISPMAKAITTSNVSWHGGYIGHVESNLGATPGWHEIPPSFNRPCSLALPACSDGAELKAKSSDHNSGVLGGLLGIRLAGTLARAQADSRSEFTGYGKKKSYGHGFSPEGPLLVKTSVSARHSRRLRICSQWIPAD
jgi:hypothetical protein